uniref:Ionotropic glutamate receptor C-terminal domain-containing protein n=1 Tax=Fagus sylvatica TaxID=28930 RepID=A0A2N9INE9_FAGSY
MKNKEVQAIIGPARSSQARFVIELGRKAQVPIISFSATSPSLSPSQNPFFIRTTHDDSAQVKAIADIVKAFGWREVVPIYEDTDYGNGLIPYLMDALQEIDTRVPYRSVIPPSSNNTEIIEELNKLKANHTRIFIVHMTASLGSKLFVLANNAKMMKEGYAWILTEGLSSLLDPMGSKVMDSMQGVLGIRPYIPPSKNLEDFKRKLKRNLTTSSKRISFNLFGLWAYDTVWALAMAVEKAGVVHSSFLKQNASNSNVDLAALGISEMGSRLCNTILTTKFQGLSGNFSLVKGELEPSNFELFNVIGNTERIIGYWTRQKGFSQDLNDTRKEAYSTSKDKLKQPIWPGYTIEQPTKLRIGVPVRRGFEEFLKVEWHSNTNKPSISGFSIDVFLAVKDALHFPLPYEFIPYMNTDRQSNGTYDELLYQITIQKYDAVVGDTTIVANRSLYVDFTLPYSESAFIITGLVIWVLEHRVNNEFRGPPKQQLGLILWFSFSTLAFAHSFDESKLKSYNTPEEYHEALLNGIHNGGVAAIFDEIPYIKLFLAKYCTRYTMVGPTYKTDGFGFALRKGSPLVPYISRAILNVTQDKEKIGAIEHKYFSSQTTCEDQSTTISSHSPSLGVDSFGGLFLIAGIASMVSLLVTVFKFFYSHWPALSHNNTANCFWSKLVEMAKCFDQKDLSSHTFKTKESSVHAVTSPDILELSPSINDMQNHSRNSLEGTDDVVIHDGNISLSSRHGGTYTLSSSPSIHT